MVLSFILKDFAGNQKIVAIEITNIDRENPEIDFSNVEDKWYNQPFNINVTFSDDRGLNKISFPDSTEEILSSNPTIVERTYTINKKGSHTFKAYDMADNVGVGTVIINKYDAKAPVYIAGSETSDIKVEFEPDVPTNTNIKVKIIAKDADEDDENNSSIKQISRVVSDDVDSKAEEPYENNNGDEIFTATFEVTDNGEYYFVIEDIAGNKTLIPVIVNNIDKTDPVITFDYDENQWHNKEFTVNVKFTDDFGISKISLPGYDDETLEDKLKTVERTYTVSKKGSYTFKVYDEAGNEAIETIIIDKYDSMAPVYVPDSETSDITVKLTPDAPTNMNVDIEITAKDAAANDENNSSGIRQINRVSDNDINSGIIDPHTNDNGDEEFITEFEVHDNGEYYFVVEDNAGNKTLVPVTVSNIDRDAPTINFTFDGEKWYNNPFVIDLTLMDDFGLAKVVFNENVEGVEPEEQNLSGAKEETVTYTINRKGKHTFTVYDISGNKTTEIINDVKYDALLLYMMQIQKLLISL